MSPLNILIGGCVITLYIPLWLSLSRGTLRQNIATWILWVVLDAIAFLSIWWQGGNYLLVALYVIGGSVTIFITLRSRHFAWTKIESVTTLLVIVSIVMWALSGARMGTIMSTLGVVFAGVPQLIDSWRNPRENSVVIYGGFTGVNVLALLEGKNWSIEERFYPFSCALLCLGITLATARRYWRTSK